MNKLLEKKIELLIKKEKMLLNCANILIQFDFYYAFG